MKDKTEAKDKYDKYFNNPKFYNLVSMLVNLIESREFDLQDIIEVMEIVKEKYPTLILNKRRFY
jgi:hypothetical protein